MVLGSLCIWGLTMVWPRRFTQMPPPQYRPVLSFSPPSPSRSVPGISKRSRATRASQLHPSRQVMPHTSHTSSHLPTLPMMQALIE